MKVFAVLLVALATAFSQVVGEEGSSVVKIVSPTLLGPRTCQGTLLNSQWVLTSAACCSGTLWAKVYAGYDGSVTKTVLALAFIKNPIHRVCLIPVGLNPASPDISYATLYTGDLEEGQVFSSVAWGPAPPLSVNVTFTEDADCWQIIQSTSSADFCTDGCLNIQGGGLYTNGSIVAVNTFGNFPPREEFFGPCSFTTVSSVQDWIYQKTGVIN